MSSTLEWPHAKLATRRGGSVESGSARYDNKPSKGGEPRRLKGCINLTGQATTSLTITVTGGPADGERDRAVLPRPFECCAGRVVGRLAAFMNFNAIKLILRAAVAGLGRNDTQFGGGFIEPCACAQFPRTQREQGIQGVAVEGCSCSGNWPQQYLHLPSDLGTAARVRPA